MRTEKENKYRERQNRKKKEKKEKKRKKLVFSKRTKENTIARPQGCWRAGARLRSCSARHRLKCAGEIGRNCLNGGEFSELVAIGSPVNHPIKE
ncbi:hypothetical protein CEXT_87521 [Caerostris extrusa]|uniref:Uncharacterized protein n=1 Tax=Caerostris extrusa TaxID=172846 RepID=A0AAV4Y1F5_CAEEX|nr:hypothetical protein CEXT_87521 [Caerostris extrusa]